MTVAGILARAHRLLSPAAHFRLIRPIRIRDQEARIIGKAVFAALPQPAPVVERIADARRGRRGIGLDVARTVPAIGPSSTGRDASRTGRKIAVRHMLDILQSRSLSGPEREPNFKPSTPPRRRQVHVFRVHPGAGDALFRRPCRGDTFRELVDWQIAEGSNALVPCGTTGEVATLSHDEHREVVAMAVAAASGRVPVIAGCGSYSTAVSIEMIRAAADVGADAALVVVPYYNKPSQAGLAAHFTAIAEQSPLPIIIYNVPSRTVTDISVDTLGGLAKLPKIVGVKDATGNLARVTAQRLACGTDFCQLSGNDDMALGFSAMGGVGCISVTANVAPRLCADFQTAMREGRWEYALELQDRLYPLHAALFSDASPGPAKYALSRVRKGFPTELRLPLTEPSSLAHAVDAALEHAGLA